MVPFSRLLSALSEVPDPRRAEGKRSPLAPLLLFTVLALLSGATSYRRVIIFLEQRRGVLNEVFGFALKRAPAVNTLRTVLQDLVSRCTQFWFFRILGAGKYLIHWLPQNLQQHQSPPRGSQTRVSARRGCHLVMGDTI
jgi:hypothetical protein